jgi:hypothetical protein
MQLVGEDPVAAAIVSVDDVGGVQAEVVLPDRATKSRGGFELNGSSGNGVLLNMAAFIVDEDGCGATGW